MKKLIGGWLLRRLIEGAGVGSIVGIENDLVQAGGAIAAAASLVWSLVVTIREHRKQEN